MSLESYSIFSYSIEPCFFYNTGGCNREDCRYLHIYVNRRLEKPQEIKTPCRYYHLDHLCKDKGCRYGHVELKKYKWSKYFKKNFPGEGYGSQCQWLF
jgi:hypothetical protein